MTKTIKLMKHYVTDGEIKARCWYSKATLTNGRECITIYAKDYSDGLGKIFSEKYENDTDIMTDYFDKGRVRIYANDPLYAEAAARAR